MQVRIHGTLDAQQTIANLDAIIRLFQEQYGIKKLSSVTLNATLLNEAGEPIELFDISTAQMLQTIDIYHTNAVSPSIVEEETAQKPYLKLVVDNTHK